MKKWKLFEPMPRPMLRPLPQPLISSSRTTTFITRWTTFHESSSSKMATTKMTWMWGLQELLWWAEPGQLDALLSLTKFRRVIALAAIWSPLQRSSAKGRRRGNRRWSLYPWLKICRRPSRRLACSRLVNLLVSSQSLVKTQTCHTSPTIQRCEAKERRNTLNQPSNSS